MALTFNEIIARANMASPNAEVHVFVEYADGGRGYYRSYPSVEMAKRYLNSKEGENRMALAYDRYGNDID